jgi:putative aldouronate transport system permease protein
MGILFYPRGFSLEGYRLVFKNEQIFVGYMNTFIYLGAGLTVNMIMTTLCAYALSRKGFMLKRIITFVIMFTMYFSGGLIPFYLLIKGLDMINTRAVLIFPLAINTFNMIVLRTAFANIPVDLEESAKIDGANDFVIMFRIVVPLSVATIMVIGLYYAVGIWNAWFHAAIFISKRELFPLQLVLREILITAESSTMAEGMSDVNQDIFLSEIIKYATIIVTIVPILLVYPFIQKYFVKGVMIGAIKG